MVQLHVAEKRSGSFPLAEAVGIVPVTLCFAVLLWLAFVCAVPDGEAGLGRRVLHPAPEPANTWQGAGREHHLLILVTFPDERALDLHALVKAEATLRNLLGEPVRNVDLVATHSREEAESVLSAIRNDQLSPPFGVQVEGILVP